MTNRANIAIGLAFAGALAVVAWLWRDRADAIRERDYVVWRYVSGCNAIGSKYDDVAMVGADLQARTNAALVRNAEERAKALAWQLEAYAPWLEDCSLDIRRVEDLNRDLAAALRLGLGEDVLATVRELRALVPARTNRDRTWIRIREVP